MATATTDTSSQSGIRHKDLRRLKKLASKDKVVRKRARRGLDRIHSLRGRKGRLKKLAGKHQMRAHRCWWVSGVDPGQRRLMEMHMILCKMARKAAKSKEDSPLQID